jgi:hypothetical protein
MTVALELYTHVYKGSTGNVGILGRKNILRNFVFETGSGYVV